MSLSKDMVHNTYHKIRKFYALIYRKRTDFVINSIDARENILILGAREAFIKRIIEHTGNKLNYYLVDKFPCKIEGTDFRYEYSDLNERIPYPGTERTDRILWF